MNHESQHSFEDHRTEPTNRTKLVSRRKALTVAAATASIPYFPWTQQAFANDSATDRPKVGCIGLGGMGSGDARGHSRFGDIVACCDVDLKHAERANNDERIAKGKADVYTDYRKVLDREDIDVVSIVTPDHWHVKIAVESAGIGQARFLSKAADSHVRGESIDSRSVREA